jgi:hypothetical protein
MEIKQRICDVCRDPNRATKRYTVICDGRKAETDRCDEHNNVLEAILEERPLAPGQRAVRPPRRGGPARPKIMTLDEIEALKHR